MIRTFKTRGNFQEESESSKKYLFVNKKKMRAHRICVLLLASVGGARGYTAPNIIMMLADGT